MDLTELLQEKVDEAQRRVDTAKIALAEEESTLRKWKDALALALAENGTPLKLTNVVRKPKPTFPLDSNLVFSLSESRTKSDIVLTAFKRVSAPLFPAQAFNLVKDGISKSMFYKLLRDMKKNGTIEILEDGRLQLPEVEGLNCSERVAP